MRYRSITAFFCSLCTLACWGCAGSFPGAPAVRIPGDETIIARGLRDDVVFEAKTDKTINISISHLTPEGEKLYRELSCDVTAKIAGQWSLVDVAVGHGVAEVTMDLAINPNRYQHGCVVAVARLGQDGGFVIKYTDDARALSSASDAVRAILTACAADNSFEIPRLIYRAHQ
jgi:hypothetical protein